ncbi:MAG: BON domain-containing protein, partial [Rhodothermales bacterium]|nr:BON domain-containing protein [Rhodothermales bacterium]
RNYDRSGRDYERGYDRDYDRSGREGDRGYGRGSASRDYGRGSDYGRDYDRSYGGRDYGLRGRSAGMGRPRYDRDEYGRDPDRGQEYDRGYSRGYGRGRDYGGRDYGGRDYDRGVTTYSYTEYWLIPGPMTGRGPEGYQRSASSIREDVNERLTHHGQIDASGIEVHVENGEVTLKGTVDSEREKQMAEDTAEDVSGVNEVHNRLTVTDADEQEDPGPSGSGAQGEKAGSKDSRSEKGTTSKYGRSDSAERDKNDDGTN